MHHYLEIEKNCSFKCVFCVRGKSVVLRNRVDMWASKELDYIPLSEIVSKDIRNGRVVLTGGEPTLNPDLYDILVHLKEPDRKNSVTLQTNATRFCDPDFTKKVAPYINGLQIPCYGGTREVFEASCGVTGAWDMWNRALDNLHHCSSFRGNVSAIVVLTKINIDSLEDIISVVNAKDIFDEVFFKSLHYTSFVVDNKDLIGITQTEELTKLDKKLSLVHKPYSVDDAYPCILEKLGLSYEEMGYSNLLSSLYTKIHACENCKHVSCRGVEKNYLKVFGDSEFTS